MRAQRLAWLAALERLVNEADEVSRLWDPSDPASPGYPPHLPSWDEHAQALRDWLETIQRSDAIRLNDQASTSKAPASTSRRTTTPRQ